MSISSHIRMTQYPQVAKSVYSYSLQFEFYPEELIRHWTASWKCIVFIRHSAYCAYVCQQSVVSVYIFIHVLEPHTERYIRLKILKKSISRCLTDYFYRSMCVVSSSLDSLVPVLKSFLRWCLSHEPLRMMWKPPPKPFETMRHMFYTLNACVCLDIVASVAHFYDTRASCELYYYI